MERTTRAQIQAKCDALNRALGLPEAAYTQGVDGHYKANVGNIHLDHNIGGWAIEQMGNEGGGITQPFGGYRMTAWECWHALSTACAAVQMAQERSKLQEAA